MSDIELNKTDLPRAQKRPWLSPPFVKAMLAGHSALGLAFAALIYIVCLTGTVCVFLHELNRWEQPNVPIVAVEPSSEAITEAVRAGFQQASADGAREDLVIAAPSVVNPRFSVSYHGGNIDADWIADADGRLVSRVHAPWSEFVGALHMNLHLPRTWGMFLVGLTGVALLSSLISGILSHPRIFKDAFALRWGGSKRLQEADLHNRLSVWGLPFHFVVTLSGALLGLSTLIVGVLALAAYDGDSEQAFAAILGPRATQSAQSAPLPDVAAMIASVKEREPGAWFVYADLQRAGWQGQMVHLAMRTPGHLSFANVYYFNGEGELIGEGGFEAGGIGQQILGVLQPLHFGWFGGTGTKVIYAVLGLALTVITQSGVVIWLARRRDKGRAVPVWERVWTSVVWGQVLALAVPLAASLLVAERFLVPIYCVVTVASLVFAVASRDAGFVRSCLQILSAMVLGAAAFVHAAIWSGRILDSAAIYVSAALVVSACVIVALSGVLRRRAEI